MPSITLDISINCPYPRILSLRLCRLLLPFNFEQTYHKKKIGFTHSIAIRHEITVPTLRLSPVLNGIEITAHLDTGKHALTETYTGLVCPRESFGGFSYDELLEIAISRGQLDADELRV